VDRTRNNTSMVMRWTHGQTRLLFTGDAEETSWTIMRQKQVPLAAHAIKVGHHGSINASPPWSFTEVLPTKAATNAAIVSTEPSRFTGENEVPKREVLDGWKKRLTKASRLLRTDTRPLGKPVIVRFES
jgi:beta-lactamase superfamily II metal-dependent hydrolase